jgi:hypothetical protein
MTITRTRLQHEEPAVIEALAEFNANELTFGRPARTWHELTLGESLWVVKRSYEIRGI